MVSNLIVNVDLFCLPLVYQKGNIPKLYSMGLESIEMFFDTRCTIGDTDEAATSRNFYVKADFGFFDTPPIPKPFVASKQGCYGEYNGKPVR